MTITGAIVVFIIGWWLSFFVVLPFGVRGQHEDGQIVPGTESGAPNDPMIAKKAIWATIGAVVITAIAALIVPQLLAG
jgi:predicted secreted protein